MVSRVFLRFFGMAAALAVAGASVVCGQTPSPKADLKLNLKGDKPAQTIASPLGEFRISLDSQMVTGDDQFVLPPSRVASQDFVLRSRAQEDMALLRNDRPEAGGEEHVRRVTKREFGSTLTLTAGYMQDSRQNRPAAKRAIGAGAQGSRWSLYGEVGQENPLVMTTSRSPDSSAEARSMQNISTDGKRANSIMDVSGALESGPPALAESRIPTLNNYYLEAMYRFRPELRGRVSYQRSTADLQDRNEHLQLEGIVDTGKDFTIKAGYLNQTAPETGERKPLRDKKIWTEFILKF
ncbi:MAG: hypothetical protein WA705_20100 [Candidatus Ozemobacteraceae bacterium]